VHMLRLERADNMIKEFQKIRLTTGEEAIVVEILEKDKAFLVDIKKAEDEYETDEITIADISSVFDEVERQIATA